MFCLIHELSFPVFQLNPIIGQTSSASMSPDSQTNIIGSTASSPYHEGVSYLFYFSVILQFSKKNYSICIVF
jgi:hypothetical protein